MFDIIVREPDLTVLWKANTITDACFRAHKEMEEANTVSILEKGKEVVRFNVLRTN